MNVHRLREPVATHTFCANCKSLGGYTCAQVFYGITSHMINVYGMKSESEVPKAYQDFMRMRGIPHTLRQDNATSEKSEEILELNRKVCSF